MTNNSNSSKSLSQNQKYSNGQNKSEQGLTKPTNSDCSSLPTPLESSKLNQGEFSSIAQDELDTLPKVWVRGFLYLLVIFAAIALPWTMFSQVDETGSARGRLEPKGATVRIDASISGTVTEVKVQEGQLVKQGQILLELESDVLRNDLQQVQTKLEGQINRLTQMKLIENQNVLAISAQAQQNQSQALEKEAQVNQAQQSLDAIRSNAPAQESEKLAQVNQSRQILSTAKSAYILAESRFKKDELEVDRYRRLSKEGVVAEVKLVEIERSADESQRLRTQAQADIKQAEIRLQEQLSSYEKLMKQLESDLKQAEYRLQEQESSLQSLLQSGKLALLKSQEQLKNLQSQITTLQSEITQSKSQSASLTLQLDQRILRSPINGVIFQLPTKKAKAFIQAGQLVAQIAPQGSTLVLKAQMPSQESGFLQVGMPVKVKFDAYPFQDYGIVPGRVVWISPDSKIVEAGERRVETFELEIELERDYIQNQGKRLVLTPGQSATAEVVVRQRRIIDFILDPFRQLQEGGLKL